MHLEAMMVLVHYSAHSCILVHSQCTHLHLVHSHGPSAIQCTRTIVHPKALVVYSNGTITMVFNYDHHQKMTGH